MKLNPDCIRDILLSVEETCDISHNFVSNEDKPERLQKYSFDEVAYHARQCDMSGFLLKYIEYAGIFETSDLTPKGHEFLANIREDTIWNNVKSVSSKVGSKSLSALSSIASAVITEIIKMQLGTP